MSRSTIIKEGNQAVLIVPNWTDQYVARLYVNARTGNIEDWTPTAIRFKGKTLNGAIKWANKQLGKKPEKQPSKPEPDIMQQFLDWISQ